VESVNRQRNMPFAAVFEKTCATTQKNIKSHVFWILRKNVKKCSRAT